MIEYVITSIIVLVSLLNKPVPLIFQAVELVAVIYVVQLNILLGIISAFAFMRQEQTDGLMKKKSIRHGKNRLGRFSLDEQLRPKESDTTIRQQSGLPPSITLVGQMETPVDNTGTGNYTPF